MSVAPPDQPRVPKSGPSFVLVLAVWTGILAAVLELAGMTIRRLALDEFLFVGRDVWWTVPLVDVVLFLVVGVGLLLLRLVWRSGPWWQIGLWVFGFLGTVGVLYTFPELHRLAAALIGAGVATQVVRLAGSREARFRRLVQRTAPWLLLLAVGSGVVIRGRAVWRERRSLAGLPAAPAGAPNVLLIVLDTVRAIDLGLYGHSKPTTPELERWIQRGVVYRWAFSTAPWTLPSHASMFTGRLVHEMAADWMVPLEEEFPTLAEALASRGYATAGFSANTDYVSDEVGLARGFAHFDDYSLTPGLMLRSAALGRAVGRNRVIRRLLGIEKLLGRKDAPEMSAAFLDWIDGREGPWFGFINYYDAHRPYQPPAPYDVMFASDSTRPDPRFRQDEDPENPWTPQDVRNFLVAYDGAIAYLDAQLSLLFAELERRGLFGRTLVIVTSDHGEEFGEHRLYDHGHSLYQASVHVPLLVWLPRGEAAGREVNESVSLRDIPATVMDLAGGTGTPFPGRSLARFWREGGPGAPDTVVSGVKRVLRQPEWYPASRGDMIALTTDSLRFIRNLGDSTEEMYRSRTDMAERDELSQTGAGRIAAGHFRARVAALTAGINRGADQSQ
jgi:arylsulfatase A-like enzyme